MFKRLEKMFLNVTINVSKRIKCQIIISDKY